MDQHQNNNKENINTKTDFTQVNDVCESVADNAVKTDFSDFASILDIKNSPETSAEQSSVADVSVINFFENQNKKKSVIATIICIFLCVTTVICSTFAVLNFIENKSENTTPTEPSDTVIQNSQPQTFDPFGELTTNFKNVNFPDSINESLKAMYSENKDLAGWLTIEGTSIDFPVVQYNNNSYYLNNHNAYNKKARYGTPFVDFRCSKTELSKNTIIYGHHMKNKTHFGALDYYEDVKYYKNHPLIKYSTLTGDYTFKIYAVFYATTNASDDGGYVFDYYNPDMSDENFAGYIDMVNQYALYTTDAGLEKTDKIITLSTCIHLYDNLKKGGVSTRFVVVGRLLREGETDSVDTDKVTINNDYRRPQVWYDKNKLANPYSAYRSWHPSL